MVHDAAGLLKQFLRDLPDSLLTVERTDAFLKALGQSLLLSVAGLLMLFIFYC